MAGTLYDKLWEAHVIKDMGDGSALIHVDRHLLQETSTHQSFADLRARGRAARRPGTHLGVPDHAVPSDGRSEALTGAAAEQVAQLATNARDFGLPHIPLDDPRQGIVHVIGPEQGFTLPGITLACGDSHTSTHGAFGALPFGIGASDCAMVLATQCLIERRAKTMEMRLAGMPAPGVGAKDIALAMIGRFGSSGANGHAVEYRGAVIDAMSMAARMTLCNMTIEFGARVGLVAPDDTTFAWLAGRPYAPQDAQFDQAERWWRTLPSAVDAVYDTVLTLDVSALAPQLTWGTNPQDVIAIDGCVPDPAIAPNAAEQRRRVHALAYMGLTAGMAAHDIAIDHVFIGSCTNGRIEDLREAAAIARGRSVSATVRALVVPGSTQVKHQAEQEGLDRIFRDAGFGWGHAGCSMCVAMNADRLAPGERCASTSNRNFEGRQGRGGRTHLMSPAMAAAAAIAGHLTDVRDLAPAA